MIAQKRSLILVFDSNIFFKGIDFNIFNEIIYTTPQILEEIEVKRYYNKNRNILNKIQVAIERKKLILKEPSLKYEKIVEEKSKKMGLFKSLSKVDKNLIALTLELSDSQKDEVILYTNDYSMENLCLELNLKFSPLYKKGIKKKIIFEIYCPHCNKIYQKESLNNECEICGTKLRRRPKNISNI